MSFDSMYQGKRPFTREQLVFVVEATLAAAMDMIESWLPSAGTSLEDRKALGLASYERGALETAGMSLSIFCAQLTGDGLGAADALMCCRVDDVPFHEMVQEWVRKSVASGENTAPNGVAPEARPWAEAFVNECFQNTPHVEPESEFHEAVHKWVEGGYQLEDSGLIEFPDEDGSISYRDQYGNHEATWTPGTEEHEEYLKIFTGENSPWTVWKCPECGIYKVVGKDELPEIGTPFCTECGWDDEMEQQ